MKLAVVFTALAFPKFTVPGPAARLHCVVSAGGDGFPSSLTVALRLIAPTAIEGTALRSIAGAVFSGTMLRLVNVQTFSTPAVPPELSTAKPIRTGVLMMIVCGWPSCVHVPGLPLTSAAWNAVTRLPCRMSRIQRTVPVKLGTPPPPPLASERQM